MIRPSARGRRLCLVVLPLALATNAWADEPRHWSFRPVARPDVPARSDSTWPRNPIDAFALSKLKREGRQPAPEADRSTLLRRLCFDLLGLPPAPEEQAAFLADA